VLFLEGDLEDIENELLFENDLLRDEELGDAAIEGFALFKCEDDGEEEGEND
jgi:hypothetical protein